MARKVISLSLPEELLDRIDEHYIMTGYASLSEYIRELVRNDLRQNGKDPEVGRAWRSRPRKAPPSGPAGPW
jgi:metal-responsive CopG/Arc/MetJ family transcriptional regulator